MALEFDTEKFLKIKTSGRDDSNSTPTNFPYEATSYYVLQELACSNYITKADTIIDFGCGKGRVDFYLASFTKAKMIGVEYDIRLYNRALDNLSTARSKNRVSFIHSCASLYEIPNTVTGAYFFNPFSIFILKSVLNNILDSYNKENRDIHLFFYYPSDEYLLVLDSLDFVKHVEDIDCKHLFKGNDNREIISIYKII